MKNRRVKKVKETSRPIVCMTCDVEIQRKEELGPFKKILQMLDSYSLRGTFFLIISQDNYDAFENLDLQSYSERHEFGLHIHWGDSMKTGSSERTGLRSVPIGVLSSEIKCGIERCQKLGFTPKSFRGGGLCQTTEALKLISGHGFRVDSSVAARLNEKERWFQRHLQVPYRSWYFPSKEGYHIPASNVEDRIGILEIPVTRLIPSLGSWFPYTLTPTTPLSKIIINEWLFKSHWESPLLITPIFHSWSQSDYRWHYNQFLSKLSKMMKYILDRRLEPLTFREVCHLLKDGDDSINSDKE